MDPKAAVLVKVLLNAYYGNNANGLCRFMEDAEADVIRTCDVSLKDYSYAYKTPYESIERIHFSWLAPAVSAFSPKMRPVIVASLPPNQSAGLRQMLSIEKVPPLSQIAKKFLLHLLYEKMELSKLTPEELLPQSQFERLINWDKTRLCYLIDLLSMYDLAEKLRQIVDRKRLREIYSNLDKNRLEFLKQCMKVKAKVSASDLHLERWRGDPKELEHILHRRGLIRFGRALAVEPPEVRWYITHRLDTGRSSIIERCVHMQTPPAVLKILVQQVQNVIEYIG